MFGKNRADNVEFCRRHMVAVRLVDAINFAAHEVIPEYKPILLGFKLKVTQEKAAPWHWNESPKLLIQPAEWPKGCVISCFLIQRDGWYTIEQGEMITPQGCYIIHGDDMATWVDYTPRRSQLEVVIFPKHD